MPNRNLKCTGCKGYFPRDSMTRLTGGNFHSIECQVSHGMKAHKKTQERQIAKAKRGAKVKAKAATKQHRADKERVKRRSEWFDDLQALVNQYVKYVMLLEAPCCTCGKPRHTGKFDAGHCFTRGGRPDIRFELTNINPQCVKCNQYNGGRQAEHKAFIAEKHGQAHLDWLEGQHNHIGLKERFPHYTDIKDEIARYRKLLRDAGLKPRK